MTASTIRRRVADLDVFPIALGGMWMSLRGRAPEELSIRTLHAALDAGVTMIDTADAYSTDDSDVGHNERLIAKALAGRRDDAIIATKAGHIRVGTGWDVDGRPEHIRSACEASLRALGSDRIDLYYYHRPDPKVPYAETVGAFKELQDAGKVRWVGLSNATVAQLEEALEIVEIVALQNQLALDYVSPIAKGELQACSDRGIAFLPWSPLGGMGSGVTAESRVVSEIAEARGASPQRIALAWLLALGPTVIPVVGSTRPQTIADSAGAAEIELSAQETRAISASVGVAGDA